MDKVSKNYYVYVTSFVGNLGTKILIDKKKDVLLEHYTKEYIDKVFCECDGGSMPPFDLIDVVDKEDVKKGGVLASLWKICDRNKFGLRYSLKEIPVLQGTIEIANFFDINPYRLLTSNSYVVISQSSDLNNMSLIGETNGEKKRVRIDGETEAFLTKCFKDELDKICKY